jgi:Terpene cyclase DEP1
MSVSTSVSTSTNIRHAFFILAGVMALVLTWPHAFQWMAAGGNILNPVEFFGDAMAPGGTAAFLSIDMAIAWLVFMVWVVFDSKRIGLGYKWGWIFVALSYIGVSMAFPVYLVTRERFLEKRAPTGEFNPNPT